MNNKWIDQIARWLLHNGHQGFDYELAHTVTQ